MKTKTITPYISFGGNCQAALDFYKSALKAEINMVMTFDQSPDPVPEGMLAPGFESKVMHSSFTIGQTEFYASDGCRPEDLTQNVSFSIPAESKEEADQIFNALSEGGQVTMPLTPTFWSPYFGMVQDKFGIGWMVSLPGND